MLPPLMKALALMLSLVSSHSLADSQCESEVLVSINDTWRPYSYLADGVLRGSDIDIIKSVFAKTSLCPTFAVFPSSTRGVLELQRERVDMLYAATYTHERASYADFSIPYRHEVMSLFSHVPLKEDEGDLARLLSEGKTVVANPGSYYGEDVAKLSEQYGAQFVYVPKADRRVKLVVSGKVDLLIADELTGQHYGSYVYPNQLFLVHRVLHQSPVRFMFKKGRFSTQQLSEINQAINRSEVEISNIISTYTANTEQRN